MFEHFQESKLRNIIFLCLVHSLKKNSQVSYIFKHEKYPNFIPIYPMGMLDFYRKEILLKMKKTKLSLDLKPWTIITTIRPSHATTKPPLDCGWSPLTPSNRQRTTTEPSPTAIDPHQPPNHNRPLLDCRQTTVELPHVAAKPPLDCHQPSPIVRLPLDCHQLRSLVPFCHGYFWKNISYSWECRWEFSLHTKCPWNAFPRMKDHFVYHTQRESKKKIWI